MSSDNNNPTSIGGDQSPLSSSTGSRFVMNSSGNRLVSSAPKSGNVAHLTEKLSADEVAIIFGFLSHVDIMRARVCTTWREAAKKTLVPPTDFRVNSVRSYNAMRVMATTLPNLQQLLICGNGEHKFNDGDDPDEEWARLTANDTTHDIDIISSFRKLRSLKIISSNLNGRYPVFFNFPLLQRLSLTNCIYLKWDLEMLASFPLLRELQVGNSNVLTGDLSSLRALRDTLEMVKINGAGGFFTPTIHIRGNFIDLADFPRLKELDLYGTTVTGHIGDIRGHDFPALERLRLPKSVRGGMRYEFQSISDAPDFMNTVHLLLQRIPTLFEKDRLPRAFGWSLSKQSPDWYAREIGRPRPPLSLRFIQAGSRHGWSWCSYDYKDECHSCEINWLDPEPSSESDDYEAYIEALNRVEEREDMDFYRGYNDPPTEQQYCRLCEEVGQRD